MATTPRPTMADLAHAASFLDTLEERGQFVFQTFDDTEAKRPELARTFYGTLQQHHRALIAMNERGAGIYVTVNKTAGARRRAVDIVALRALFVDADGQPMPAAWHRPPSMIIRRDDLHWHAYWILSPDSALSAFTPAQKRLAAHYHTDPAVNDLSRVMRIPGFYHNKATPIMVTLHDWNFHERKLCKI